MYSYFYRVIQNILLKKSFYEDLIRILINYKKFTNIVEIGCADGLILSKIDKNIKYFGYEIDNNYIIKLKNKYLNNKNYSFYNNSIENINFYNFDSKNTLIVLIGVFHHIPDSAVHSFLNKTKNFAVYAVDAVRLEDQNLLTKILLNNDKGKFIRNFEEYRNLLNDYEFLLARNKYLRFSYDHLISFKNLDSSLINSIVNL